MINILPYILLANVFTTLLEYLYRIRFFASFWSGIWVITPIAVLIEYGLYHALRNAQNYIVAWILFAAINYVLRVLMNIYILKEPFNLWTGIGIILIFAGTIIVTKFT